MSRPDAARRRLDPVPAFAALGDATRLSIVRRLSDGEPRSIVRLSEDADITRQALTKHLRVLERAGLVTSERVGRESRFALERRRLVELRDYLDVVSRQWDDALSRLKRHVEE